MSDCHEQNVWRRQLRFVDTTELRVSNFQNKQKMDHFNNNSVENCSFLPCRICDDSGAGGGVQPGVGGHGEAQDAVEFHLEKRREKKREN